MSDYVDFGDDSQPIPQAESLERTPYGVFCIETFDVGKPPCNNGKILYLTSEAYDAQMSAPHQRWRCPRCGGEACWSDDNYESFYEAMDAALPEEGRAEEGDHDD